MVFLKLLKKNEYWGSVLCTPLLRWSSHKGKTLYVKARLALTCTAPNRRRLGFAEVPKVETKRSPNVHGVDAAEASRPAPFRASAVKIAGLAGAFNMMEFAVKAKRAEPMTMCHDADVDFAVFDKSDRKPANTSGRAFFLLFSSL